MKARRQRSARGFTMLEIMISLVILFGAMGLFLGSVSQARSQVDNAKSLTIATNLARLKMVELEAKVRDEGVQVGDATAESSAAGAGAATTEKCDDGDFEEFEDLEFVGKKWTYCAVIEKVELPPAQELTAAAGETMGAGDGTSAGAPAAAGGGGGMGMLGMLGQLDMIKGVLEQSIRRVTLEVRYPVRGGNGKGRLIVVAYFTDPKQVDKAIQVATPK